MITLPARTNRPVSGGRRARARGAAIALGLALGLSGPAPAQERVCSDPAGFCGRSAQSGCIERFGAGAFPVSGEAATEEDRACANELAVYRDCLALIASQCAPPPGSGAGVASGGGAAAASALDIWNEVKGVDDPDVLEAFADSYPSSPLAVLARKRAAELRAAASAPAPPPTPPQPSAAERAEQAAAEQAAAAEAARLRAQFLEAQGHLNRVGYAAGAEDGVWGDRSARALERFLRAQGQPVSRVLTPEALALLRRTPTPAARPATPPQRPAETPRGALKDTVAILSLEFKYNNLRRDRCRERIAVADRKLRLRKHVFEGCDRETWVRLSTEADGSASVAVVGYGTETIRVNGRSWRYSGRSFESDGASLRSVTLTVAFEDR